MSERKTVAGAYDRIADHELECARRYGELENTMTQTRGDVASLREQSDDIKRGIRWALGSIAGLALTIILGMAGVLWSSVQNDIAEARAMVQQDR